MLSQKTQHSNETQRRGRHRSLPVVKTVFRHMWRLLFRRVGDGVHLAPGLSPVSGLNSSSQSYYVRRKECTSDPDALSGSVCGLVCGVKGEVRSESSFPTFKDQPPVCLAEEQNWLTRERECVCERERDTQREPEKVSVSRSQRRSLSLKSE